MRVSRRHFLAFTAATTSIHFPALAGPALSPKQAINRSGQLRMLSQRVVKLYAQLGLGLMPEPSMAALSTAAMQAQGNLVALRGLAVPQDVREALAKVEGTWNALRDQVASTPVREEAPKVSSLADAMLAQAENLTQLLEASLGAGMDTPVNLAGRQRMLSQRIAKCYMLHCWSATDVRERERLGRSCQDFTQGLGILRTLGKNTTDIVSRIDMLEFQWGFMNAAFKPEKMGNYNPANARNVAIASDNVLRIADELTGLYEALAS